MAFSSVHHCAYPPWVGQHDICTPVAGQFLLAITSRCTWLISRLPPTTWRSMSISILRGNDSAKRCAWCSPRRVKNTVTLTINVPEKECTKWMQDFYTSKGLDPSNIWIWCESCNVFDIKPLFSFLLRSWINTVQFTIATHVTWKGTWDHSESPPPLLPFQSTFVPEPLELLYDPQPLWMEME